MNSTREYLETIFFSIFIAACILVVIVAVTLTSGRSSLLPLQLERHSDGGNASALGEVMILLFSRRRGMEGKMG